MRSLLWASIDNDDSRDLDQLTVAQPIGGGTVRILVAISEVDALVKKDSAIDGHAWTNTTSVYTPAGIFPMLPEKLSTDLTSLGEGEERLAIVMDMAIAAGRHRDGSDIYRAVVLNRAKLAYNGVDAWLEGTAPAPPRLAAVPGLEEQLRIQDRAAQALRRVRNAQGALSLETLEVRAVFDDGSALRSAAGREESREGADRGLHDRGQWRHREIPRSRRACRRCAACSPFPSAGTGSSRWRPSPGRGCRRGPTPPRSTLSSPIAARPTRSVFPTFRCRS